MSSKSKKGKKVEFQNKEKKDWSVSDVQDWLESLELGDYAAAFEREAIAGDSLIDLKPEDLEALGVIKLGHKKKLMMELRGASGGLESSRSESQSISVSHSKNKGSELLTSSSDAPDVISIKAILGDDIRKIRLATGSRLSELEVEIKERFGIRKASLKYKDAEGDKMTLASEREWDECLEETGNRVIIYVGDGHGSASNSTSSSSKKKSSTHSHSSKSSSVKEEKKPGSIRIPAFFSVFDTLLQSTLVIDEKGIVQYVNASCERLTGYSKNELLGKNVKILMPEEYARYHDAYIRTYIKTGNAKVIGKGRNVTMAAKDGSYVPIYLELTENNSTGQRTFVGTITEAREERKQQSILGMVREVLDTLVNPAVAITDKGVIQVFNKAAQAFWGYTLVEVVGKNVKMLMTPDDALHHDEYLSNYMTTGQAKIIGTGRDVVALTKDGEFRPVHLSVAERRDGEQRIFTGMLVDKSHL